MFLCYIWLFEVKLFFRNETFLTDDLLGHWIEFHLSSERFLKIFLIFMERLFSLMLSLFLRNHFIILKVKGSFFVFFFLFLKGAFLEIVTCLLMTVLPRRVPLLVSCLLCAGLPVPDARRKRNAKTDNGSFCYYSQKNKE